MERGGLHGESYVKQQDLSRGGKWFQNLISAMKCMVKVFILLILKYQG